MLCCTTWSFSVVGLLLALYSSFISHSFFLFRTQIQRVFNPSLQLMSGNNIGIYIGSSFILIFHISLSILTISSFLTIGSHFNRVSLYIFVRLCAIYVLLDFKVYFTLI